MKKRRSTEDYLKTIYILSQTKEVHACQVAEELGLSRPTVSVALKHLTEEGYLQVDRDNVIRLTEQGLQMACRVCEKYKTLKKALMKLGVDEMAAIEDACKMEHDIGNESYLALKNFVS